MNLGTEIAGLAESRKLMELGHERRTWLADEIDIIPAWSWVLAVVGFAGVQLLFNFIIARDHDAPPVPVRALLGVLVGIFLGCYVLFLGYVNRDAGRRGMSRLLWTLIAIFIPNGLGIILYFVLRQPLQSSCSQCGFIVERSFNFCPKCNLKLNPSCPQCQHAMRPGDVYCPQCGAALAQHSAGGAPLAGKSS
jgi:RNA polymerase subunit RPABC4/transcription elongation factor Spt4